MESDFGSKNERHDYNAQTTSPSDSGDIRWYYSKLPMTLNQPARRALQVIPGKGDYCRFDKFDSERLETSFLMGNEMLLSSSVSSHPQTDEEFAVEGGGISVRGGHYEVDLKKRRCFFIYDSEEILHVLRGHWFARESGSDWLPLHEDVSKKLERAYRRKVWHSGRRVPMKGFTQVQYATFTGNDDTWEAKLYVLYQGSRGALGFGVNMELRRGFAPSQVDLHQQDKEEIDAECDKAEVGHLVLMIHGIGQGVRDKNFGVDVCNFRNLTSDLSKLHLTTHQRLKQRVLFIPCEWRKGFKLPCEDMFAKTSLKSVPEYRQYLNERMYDLLCYASPISYQAVIDSVVKQLHISYSKFCKKNPTFRGKVSLVCHSLGCVLAHDILCHQAPETRNGGTTSYSSLIKYPKLEFEVDTFVTLGSPLGAILSTRNVRFGMGQGNRYWNTNDIVEEMPACRQMFNIFHPNDLVAHRIEPLVCQEIGNKCAAIIPSHQGEKEHSYPQALRETIALMSACMNNMLEKVKEFTPCNSSNEIDEAIQLLGYEAQKIQMEESPETEMSYGSKIMGRLTRSKDGRIDHSLQVEPDLNVRISVLLAHTCYWESKDAALFMMKHLYRDIPDRQ